MSKKDKKFKENTDTEEDTENESSSDNEEDKYYASIEQINKITKTIEQLEQENSQLKEQQNWLLSQLKSSSSSSYCADKEIIGEGENSDSNS